MDDGTAQPGELASRIGRRMHELRVGRRLSQAELAAQLGVSQQRVSRIERGEGSLWAEEFLALLALFNVGLEGFLPERTADASIQNALAQFGAANLREVPDVVVRPEHSTPLRLLVAVLLAPESERHVTALAPVLLDRIDAISLPAAQRALADAGARWRLPWLCENTVQALASVVPRSAAERRLVARADTVLRDFVSLLPSPESDAWDAFERGVRSGAAQRRIRDSASPISKRWRVESRLQPEDFADAIRGALESRR